MLREISTPKIPLSKNLFGKTRLNSIGRDLSNYAELEPLAKSIHNTLEKTGKHHHSYVRLKMVKLFLI